MNITIDHVKECFAKFIYLGNSSVVDAVFGCAIANQLPGPPVSMYLIGPPGSGKTELLNGFEGYYRTYHPSKITPNTLMSGYVEKGGQKQEKKSNDHSLLVRLTNQGKNILIFKDFTTILAMAHEARQTIIGQFREIADGRYVGDSGFGAEGHVEWRGKLAIITGVTNAIDELGSVNSVLGERFIAFRMRGENLIDVFAKVEEATPNLDKLHADFMEITGKFMMQFDIGCEGVSMDPEVSNRLMHLAAFIAYARTGVMRDRDHNIVTLPEREGFGRITRQLQMFGSGVALCRGHSSINLDDYRLIKKVARDTIPPLRQEYLRHVLTHCEGCTAKELIELTGVPQATMYRHLEDLVLSEVIMSVSLGPRGTSKKYYPSVVMKDHIDASEVFVYDYVE